MLVKLKNIENLNAMVIKKGFSKTALAKKANIHPVTSWKIFNGKSNPTPKTAKKICDALQVNFDDIFEIVEP